MMNCFQHRAYESKLVALYLQKSLLQKSLYRFAVLALAALALIACSDSETLTEPTDEEPVVSTTFNPNLIAAEGLAEEITIVDCTLSGGTETTCYQVVTNGLTEGIAVGPFCPDNINVVDVNEVGIWVDGTARYDITGTFILDLPNLYGEEWILYDQATGEVNVTEGPADCAAAANPLVAEEDQRQCVECLLSDVDGGISQTILIPTTPVPLDVNVVFPQNAFTMGVALNAIPLSAPAGIDDILSNFIIAAFDDCGGHINSAEGYHYHGATDCNETGMQVGSHSAQIGYAIDGYGIYGRLDSAGNESTALDECLGETDDARGYHYHAAELSENRIIGCFHGETAGGTGGGGGPPPR